VHGWADWSAWDADNERLNEARDKYPDLHRVYAIRELARVKHKPAIGLLLRVVIDDEDCRTLGRYALGALQNIGNYEDVLAFYVDSVLHPPMTGLWRQFWTEIEMVSQRMGKQEARAFWKPYLYSDAPSLWYCAQQAWDRPVPDRKWLRDASEEWALKHDPDPKIRKDIEKARKRREIRSRADPETGRLSPEDFEELQRLDAEEDD
jgi:hypothetical protein